jgi:hypothetical protein
VELLKFNFQGFEAQQDIPQVDAQLQGKCGNEIETESQPEKIPEDSAKTQDSASITQPPARSKPRRYVDIEWLLAGRAVDVDNYVVKA